MILLNDIASARSGDKGMNSNIGVIANTSRGFTFLKEFLTADRVAYHFNKLPLKSVVRYELPNLLAFNFILYGALGEGGSRSLLLDAQGKALGQKLLQMPLEIDEFELLEIQTQIRKDPS